MAPLTPLKRDLVKAIGLHYSLFALFLFVVPTITFCVWLMAGKRGRGGGTARRVGKRRRQEGRANTSNPAGKKGKGRGGKRKNSGRRNTRRETEQAGEKSVNDGSQRTLTSMVLRVTSAVTSMVPALMTVSRSTRLPDPAHAAHMAHRPSSPPPLFPFLSLLSLLSSPPPLPRPFPLSSSLPSFPFGQRSPLPPIDLLAAATLPHDQASSSSSAGGGEASSSSPSLPGAPPAALQSTAMESDPSNDLETDLEATLASTSAESEPTSEREGESGVALDSNPMESDTDAPLGSTPMENESGSGLGSESNSHPTTEPGSEPVGLPRPHKPARPPPLTQPSALNPTPHPT